MERIKTIYSKAEPFQQCSIWLRANLPGVQLIEVNSTVKGVELAKDRDYAAAIGSEIAARLYNVPIVAANIEDMKDNMTRFFSDRETRVGADGARQNQPHVLNQRPPRSFV